MPLPAAKPDMAIHQEGSMVWAVEDVMTIWSIHKYRRFPAAIQPRRIMQVQTQVRRKKKIEEDRKKRIAEWLAIEMFGEPGRRPWWRRWL